MEVRCRWAAIGLGVLRVVRRVCQTAPEGMLTPEGREALCASLTSLAAPALPHVDRSELEAAATAAYRHAVAQCSLAASTLLLELVEGIAQPAERDRAIHSVLSHLAFVSDHFLVLSKTALGVERLPEIPQSSFSSPALKRFKAGAGAETAEGSVVVGSVAAGSVAGSTAAAPHTPARPESAPAAVAGAAPTPPLLSPVSVTERRLSSLAMGDPAEHQGGAGHGDQAAGVAAASPVAPGMPLSENDEVFEVTLASDSRPAFETIVLRLAESHNDLGDLAYALWFTVPPAQPTNDGNKNGNKGDNNKGDNNTNKGENGTCLVDLVHAVVAWVRPCLPHSLPYARAVARVYSVLALAELLGSSEAAGSGSVSAMLGLARTDTHASRALAEDPLWDVVIAAAVTRLPPISPALEDLITLKLQRSDVAPAARGALAGAALALAAASPAPPEATEVTR